MANGLDKLERLFSTRKKSASNRHTAESNNICGSSPNFPALPDTPPPSHFPQAPFIRPKCNVMHARNELDLSSPKSIARTNSSGSQRLGKNSSAADNNTTTREMGNQKRPNSFSSTTPFHTPGRTSSLLSRRHDRIPVGLVQLHLPRDTTNPENHTPPSLPLDARVLPLRLGHQTPQKCLLDALPIYPASHIETPPPSDQDEFSFPLPPEHAQKLSTTAALSQLTPEPSPGMIPHRTSISSQSKSSSESQRESISAPPSKRVTASSMPLLDDDWRDSYIPQQESTSSPKTKLVFDEPPVEDFLALTDEDLAEVKIVAPSKPPSKRAPPPPVLPPNVRPNHPSPMMRIMTPDMSPSLASNEVAAWEAARIAKKYDFDVVYVANFWPSGMNHIHSPKEQPITNSQISTPTSANSSFSQAASTMSSPTTSTHQHQVTRNSTPRHSLQNSLDIPSELLSPMSDCCPNSGRTNGALTRLSGRLLAAYGLETIQAPFRLSAKVHKKILRSEGWIEHRKSDARDDEFARGYARSFYTGTVTPSSVAATSSSSSTSDSAPRRASAPEVSLAINGDDGRKNNNTTNTTITTTSRVNRGIVFVAYRRPRGHGGTANSSQAELDALEKEAETLVELILDFHKERRRWETLQEARRHSE